MASALETTTAPAPREVQSTYVDLESDGVCGALAPPGQLLRALAVTAVFSPAFRQSKHIRTQGHWINWWELTSCVSRIALN